ILTRKFEGQGCDKLCRTVYKLANLGPDSANVLDISNKFPRLVDKFKQLPKDENQLLKAFLINAVKDHRKEVAHQISSNKDISLKDAYEIVLDNAHHDTAKSGSLLATKSYHKESNSDKPICANCERVGHLEAECFF